MEGTGAAGNGDKCYDVIPDQQTETVVSTTTCLHTVTTTVATAGTSSEYGIISKEPLPSKDIKISYDSIIYIGRFQPIHIGHCQMIEQAFTQTNLLIIVVGSTNKTREHKNPFNFEERKEMISQAIAPYITGYPERQCAIIGQNDHNDDDKWFSEINQKVEAEQRKFRLAPESSNHALIGYEKDDSSFYLQHFLQWQHLKAQPNLHQGKIINATDVRNALFKSRKETLSEEETILVQELLPSSVKQWIDKHMDILDTCHSGSESKTTEPE